MIKQILTLLHGRNADAAKALSDANALPILRQQVRDCADRVENARRSVAMVMAFAEREKKAAAVTAVQIADLEIRARDALAKGREDLASEAAGAIAALEGEAAATARTLATYQTEVATLRQTLVDAESRPRDLQQGQRLAIATSETQKLRDAVPMAAKASLTEAETTLSRLQARQVQAKARHAARHELSPTSNAETLRDRLAAAGCGAPLRLDAAAVLERLHAATN